MMLHNFGGGDGDDDDMCQHLGSINVALSATEVGDMVVCDFLIRVPA